MNEISCILVDDEPLALNLLADYVSRTAGLNLKLKTKYSEEALKQLQQGFEGLLFLDVEMPGINGLEILKRFDSSKAKVILVSAYPQYALDGFEHEATDYLLKPVTYERFNRAVQKAKAQFALAAQSLQPGHIFVKVEYRLQKIDFDSIHFIEGLRDYIAFHTTNGKFLSLDHLKHMEELLPPRCFIRIHKSFIVNTAHIDYIERGRIVIGDRFLPVGETYRSDVKNRLAAN